MAAAAGKHRKEEMEEDEMTLEDGDIEESPRQSFDGDTDEDGDEEEDEERDEDGDGVGSFESRQWPQSYRYVHSLLDRLLTSFQSPARSTGCSRSAVAW